jgi:methionyl-tRNA formyltransferase
LEHDWVFLEKKNIDFKSLIYVFNKYDFVNAVWFSKDDNQIRGFEITDDIDGNPTPFEVDNRIKECELTTSCRWSNNPAMFRTSKMIYWFDNIIKNQYIGVEEAMIPHYRKIISENFIKKIKRPIFNIHLSYLPFNRGAHPNFWSFIENTPAGVSIHKIDKGIDTGNIIFRKKVNFDINLDKFSTFKKTYNYLFLEAEQLFKKNFDKIYNKKYKKKLNNKKGSFHYKKDLPRWMKNWNMSIYLAKKLSKKKIKLTF